MFKEVTFSYNILSDSEKRRQYDAAGFEVSILQGMWCKIFFFPSDAAKLSVNLMSFWPLLTYFIPLLVADCNLSTL